MIYSILPDRINELSKLQFRLLLGDFESYDVYEIYHHITDDIFMFNVSNVSRKKLKDNQEWLPVNLFHGDDIKDAYIHLLPEKDRVYTFNQKIIIIVGAILIQKK